MATKLDLSFPVSVLRRWAPLAIGLVYLAILTPIALYMHRVGNYGVETDFFWSFAPQARTLLQDGTLLIEDFRGPLYPITLAGVSLIFGDFFRAGIIISLFAAAVSLGLVFAIVARLWNPAAALWTVILTAVNPVFVFYSYQACTDQLYVALAFASTYFVVTERGVRGGILGGLAYLTRFSGLSLLPAALFSRKRLWIVAAFFVTMLPWGIRCLAEKGDFFYNRNYLNFALAVHAEGAGVEWDEFWWNPETNRRFTSFTSVIAADPLRAAKKVFGNVFLHAQQDVLTGIGLPQGIFALCGLWALFRLRPNRRQWQFLLAGAALFAINLLAFYEDRFSLFLIPFYALLAALGWAWLGDWLSRRVKLSPALRYLPLILIALVLLVQAVMRGQRVLADYTPRELPTVVAELSPRLTPGTIAARKPHIAWYLNEHHGSYPAFPFVALPKTDVLNELRRRKVDYLYLGPSEWHTRPDLRLLWLPQNAPPDLKLVYSRPDLYVTVYRIVPTNRSL